MVSERTADTERSDRAAPGDRAALFVELSVAERPAIERHDGPPVHVRKHAEGFYETYAGDDPYATDAATAYGPFLDGDRYAVERDREFRTAAAFLRSDAITDVALGAHVGTAIEDREVLVGDEVAGLADGFGRPLRDHFEPRI